MVELGDAEELEAHRRTAAIASEQHGCRSEPAAGALPADRDAIRVDAELARVVMHPPQRGIAIFDPGREGVLGRQPVLDRDDHRAELARDLHRDRVLHVDAADHEAAAVDVEQRGASGRRRGSRGGVYAHRHGTVRSRDLPIVDVDSGRVDVRVQRRDQRLDPRARLLDIAQVADRQELDDRSQFRVECIGHAGMLSWRPLLMPADNGSVPRVRSTA